ncbi:MAG TPA: DUF5313 family protein [Pseudonocardiaceae bacterium]
MAETVRPGPARWLWYAFGGRLPERYREWVLRDLTARTWLARFAVRAVLRFSPVAVGTALLLILVLDAPVALGLGSVGIGSVVAVYFALSYSVESAEKRVAAHGYPAGTAARVRREREAARDPDWQRRYDEAWRRG